MSFKVNYKMSLAVYLSSSNYDHMPNGSLNEWENFYDPTSYELEANAFIPLFWSMLYSKQNIKNARYIDEIDFDNENFQIERKQYLEDFGESSYPYFVISQKEALQNLKSRKSGFLQLFGQQYEQDYFDFQNLIALHFPHYILLRTSGLDLDDKAEQNFANTIQHFEELAHVDENSPPNHFWEVMIADLNAYQDKPYFFYGASIPSEIQIQQTDLEPEPTLQINHAVPNTVMWLLAVIIAILTVAVWWFSQSILYSFITFVISAAVLSFVVIKISSKSH